jgi:hypothetical protein
LKRVLQVVSGILLLILGIASASIGGVLASTFGRDGSLAVDSAKISGAGTALVSERLSVTGGGDLQARLGEVTFGARSASGRPIFVGVGPADEIFAYLEGRPYQIFTDIGTGKSTTRSVPGQGSPDAPTTKTFWIAQASGMHPSFRWPGSSASDVRVVVMNADASSGVAATLSLGFHSTTVFPLAMTFIGVGALLGLLGVLLLVLAWRGRRKARRAAAAAASTPVTPPVVPAPVVPGPVAAPPVVLAPVAAPDVPITELPPPAAAAETLLPPAPPPLPPPPPPGPPVAPPPPAPAAPPAAAPPDSPLVPAPEPPAPD